MLFMNKHNHIDYIDINIRVQNNRRVILKAYLLAAGVAALIVSGVAAAQAPSARPPATKPPPGPGVPVNGVPPGRYGAPITTEQAEVVMAAAQAEARRRGVADSEAIAVVEPTGELILFWRGNQAQWSSFDWVNEKARTAARFQRPTKVLADELATGSLHPLAFPHAMVAGAGGEPLKIDGKIVGAIGTTGGFDEEVALAGVAALK